MSGGEAIRISPLNKIEHSSYLLSLNVAMAH